MAVAVQKLKGEIRKPKDASLFLSSYFPQILIPNFQWEPLVFSSHYVSFPIARKLLL